MAGEPKRPQLMTANPSKLPSVVPLWVSPRGGSQQLAYHTTRRWVMVVPSAGSSGATMREQSKEETELAAELSSCMLSHYKYCAAGVLLGLPLSIHKKSYWPVTLAAVAGTAADFKEGTANCRPQREALMAFIARKNAGQAKAQQEASAGTTENPGQHSPQESWPAEGRQGWPEKGWEQTFDDRTGGKEVDREGGDKW